MSLIAFLFLLDTSFWLTLVLTNNYNSLKNRCINVRKSCGWTSASPNCYIVTLYAWCLCHNMN